MTTLPHRFPDQLRKVLDAAGEPYSVTPGGRGHYQIRLAGRLVGIWSPAASANSGALMNLVAQVRRAVRRQQPLRGAA
jgi:hypothetical protein